MNDLCRSHARILHIKHFLNKFALIHHEAAAVPPERNLYAQIKRLLEATLLFIHDGAGSQHGIHQLMLLLAQQRVVHIR